MSSHGLFSHTQWPRRCCWLQEVKATLLIYLNVTKSHLRFFPIAYETIKDALHHTRHKTSLLASLKLLAVFGLLVQATRKAEKDQKDASMRAQEPQGGEDQLRYFLEKGHRCCCADIDGSCLWYHESKLTEGLLGSGSCPRIQEQKDGGFCVKSNCGFFDSGCSKSHQRPDRCVVDRDAKHFFNGERCD